ncbi:molybdopterin-containing oxidoreductase family protein [Sphaerochaeta sp.]|uniref:molybdopterin-containing oxidoreductase family protein n=1 Tax=Sphaerochaeta sp. TaxID=1972642 RepID=UPI003D110452
MDRFRINRRDFLKATAFAGTVISMGSLTGTSLVPSAHAAANEGVKIIRTNCRNCTADCGVLAHVRDGRVIKLEGDPEFGRSEGALCVKGLSGIQALYHPNRLKYPMKRVGQRGENKWKRVSWEEAIDEIAHKLMEVRSKYGAESVFASTGGGGNPNFNGACRFCDTFDTPNWFEPGAAQCYMPRTLIYGLAYGNNGTYQGSDTSLGDSNGIELYFYKERKAKSLVLWGTAPAFSGPSQAGRVLVENRARGMKTVVIDPRFTADASKADVWLPIRPGTDVALGLTWIRYIIANKLYDADFVKRWSNLPLLVNTKTKMIIKGKELFKDADDKTFVVWDKKTNSAKPLPFPYDDKLEPALEGTFTVNGVQCKPGFQLLKERAEPWTLEKGGKECWLNPKSIEKAIKIYTKDTPSSVSLGVATDQNPNSAQSAQMSAVLNILMGNFEKPGVMLQRYEDKGVGGVLRTSKLKGFLSEKQLNKRLGSKEHKGMLHWWIAQPTAILDAMTTGKPYKMKAWLERSGNKLGTVANAGAWVKGMSNLELIVHMYMYPTSFSAYADYLLPVTEWLETDFITASFNQMFARQATTHLYETVNEAWIWARIAKRCGELGHTNCKRSFVKANTAPESPYFDTYEHQLDEWTSFFGMTWKEYKAKCPFEYIPMNRFRRYYVYKETDPKTGKVKGFNTPTGKVEGYMESLIVLGRTGKPFTTFPQSPASKDYDPLPYYMTPAENPYNSVGKKFPLVMTNGRLPFWHHTTLRNIPYLREIKPYAEIWVNPMDAKKYGVSQGDWVWVESARGKIQAKALVTEGMAKGVVYMERFWNPETLNSATHGWREMNVNVLSKQTAPFNDICGTYTLRGYQVKISKASGAPKGIWQKPEQFEPWMPKVSEPTKTVEL